MRRRGKALNQDMMHSKRVMKRANQLVGKFGDELKRQYGFLADPSKPLWFNDEKYVGELKMADYAAQSRNMACHNLLEKKVSPKALTFY